MSVRFHLAQGLYGLAFVAILPAAGLAQQNGLPPSVVAKKYAQVGSWMVEAYAVEGQHMRCGAVPPSATAGKSAIEVSAEGWTLIVDTSAKGDELKGTVDIDGKTTRGTFYRRDDNRIMTFLKDTQIKQVRSGKAIAVTVGAEKTAIPLTGVDSVLRKTKECNDRGGN